MRHDWHGLLKIEEVCFLDKNGVIFKQYGPIYNTIHLESEFFFLKALFNNNGSVIPTNYLIGLDNRETLEVADTISDLVDEPSGNGYQRQTVSSSVGWTVDLFSGVYRTRSNIITFTASGGSIGPIETVFLTGTDGTTDIEYLLSSAKLEGSAELSDGESLSLRMVLTLRDYDT